MKLKELRRRCEARLQEFELSTPFDVHAFCAALAARRGRPILLRPVASRSRPWGLWVAGPSADIIFYEQETSPLHQEHIILHEASHLLCGHRPVPVAVAELQQLLFPDLRPEIVWRVLHRSNYSGDEELEAELLASLILERAAGTPTPRTMTEDPSAVQALGRLASSLEQGSGDPP
jgi:hypothetical protein